MLAKLILVGDNRPKIWLETVEEYSCMLLLRNSMAVWQYGSMGP
jgi:hypothetical protein